MEVIILAGGLGTRLRNVVKDLPKPMAPVNNMPFLHYVFEWLSAYPVKTVVLSVGYKAEMIESFFGDKYKNINIAYAYETQPLGTGGGIKNALSKTTDNNILIINGDTYFPININAFKAFHDSSASSLSIALKQMVDFDRYGSVELSHNIILNFNEKKPLKSGLINGGIYLLNKQKLDMSLLPSVFSFESEVLEKQVLTGNVKGIVFDDEFIDIGVPEDYQRVGGIL